MLDVPKLGLDWLNGAVSHLAEVSEDSVEYDSAMLVLDNARKLVGRTKLRRAIAATSDGSVDQLRREREVMYSLMDISRMGDE